MYYINKFKLEWDFNDPGWKEIKYLIARILNFLDSVYSWNSFITGPLQFLYYFCQL